MIKLNLLNKKYYCLVGIEGILSHTRQSMYMECGRELVRGIFGRIENAKESYMPHSYIVCVIHNIVSSYFMKTYGDSYNIRIVKKNIILGTIDEVKEVVMPGIDVSQAMTAMICGSSESEKTYDYVKNFETIFYTIDQTGKYEKIF